MIKPGWVYCGHCGGEGVCKNELVSIQWLYKIFPVFVFGSDASCLAAVGGDPRKDKGLKVRCDVCKGTGHVYLSPSGYENLSQAKTSSSQPNQPEKEEKNEAE